jgi:hypothetical protein
MQWKQCSPCKANCTLRAVREYTVGSGAVCASLTPGLHLLHRLSLTRSGTSSSGRVARPGRYEEGDERKGVVRPRDWCIAVSRIGNSVDAASCSRPTGGHCEEESVCLTQ